MPNICSRSRSLSSGRPMWEAKPIYLAAWQMLRGLFRVWECLYNAMIITRYEPLMVWDVFEYPQGCCLFPLEAPTPVLPPHPDVTLCWETPWITSTTNNTPVQRTLAAPEPHTFTTSLSPERTRTQQQKKFVLVFIIYDPLPRRCLDIWKVKPQVIHSVWRNQWKYGLKK